MRMVIVLAAGLFAATPAMAQGPVGIAFAQAPEASAGVCTGGSPEAALNCARARCVAGGEGLLPSDCLRVKWCFPAGWSGDVFLQVADGPHWHEYLCGWDSRAAVEAAAAISCDRSRRDTLVECALVGLWDPDGTAIGQD